MGSKSIGSGDNASAYLGTTVILLHQLSPKHLQGLERKERKQYTGKEKLKHNVKPSAKKMAL